MILALFAAGSCGFCLGVAFMLTRQGSLDGGLICVLMALVELAVVLSNLP